MAVQADINRLEKKIDGLVEKFDTKIDELDKKFDERFAEFMAKDTSLEVRLVKLEERWKALSVVGAGLIGLLTMVMPFFHKLIGIGG